MNTVMKYLNQFFTWWAGITRLPVSKYKIGEKEFSVNWPIVSFVVLIRILMLIIL
jgi:hypothetical protein